MEKRAKVTSKGQVTIPLEIRSLLGVKNGGDVVFESTDAGVNLRVQRKVSPFEKYVGIERKGKGRSIVDIVRELREFRGHDDCN